MQATGHWHLSKEFSIGTAIGLLVNLIVIVVFAVRVDTRVEWLERQQATDSRISVIETQAKATTKSIEALELRTMSALEEIKGYLRRIEDRQTEDRPVGR